MCAAPAADVLHASGSGALRELIIYFCASLILCTSLILGRLKGSYEVPQSLCNRDRVKVLMIWKIPDSDLMHFHGICQDCHTIVWKHDEPNGSSKPWQAGSVCSCPRIDDLVDLATLLVPAV